ncbi:membrane protein [Pseudoalteromonas luteoviolacea]|nr:membrane protein [Pseudoalteromonas luteoviolacea]
MEPYFFAKLIHILAAVVVTGTGAGIAFFMFMANRSNNPQAIYITTKLVVLGDWLFTTPAVITQVVSGMYLMHLLGYSFDSDWFYAVAGLFILIGLCWLPVLKIQYRLRDLAQLDANKNQVSKEFRSLMRTWTLLGIPAFAAILIIFWLMVFKPLSVV